MAGYCWDWVSDRNPELYDFTESEFGFNMKWNMKDYGGKYIIAPESVSEIGCIHTAQGLEVDYVGVIIGLDFIIRDGVVLVDPKKRSKMDKTISGSVSGMKNNPGHWKPLLTTIIKNTYRTLMTRGMKGCYIFCVDKETNEYFKSVITQKLM